MTRFAWAGRTRNGASVSGVIEAETENAAIASVRGQGVIVSKIEATGETGTEAAPAEIPAVSRRPGESWRDKLFYIGAAALFLVLGVGAAYVAPVLRYDCRRDSSSATGCTIQRRMYGFLPLSDVRLANLVSVEIVVESVRTTSGKASDRPTAQSSLVLVSKDGGRWQSHPSSWPFGSSNSRLEQGIRGLLDGSEPAEFHAWNAEGVPTLVAVTFLAPTGLILLALLVRLAVSRVLIEPKVGDLQRELDSRRHGRAERR